MIFPIIIVLMVVFGVIAYQSHQRNVETWRRVAGQLGLQVQSGSGLSKPLITGTLNGLPVRIDTYTQRSGNSSTTYTRYQVRYPTPGLSFQLKREGGITTMIGRFFGVKDVQVGDPLFDGAFKVTTSQPERLTALLTPSVRSGLVRLLASYPTAVVSGDHVGLTTRSFERDGQRLASTIQRLVATAQLLTSPTAGVSDQNVRDREQGLLSDVADRMRRAVEEAPDDIDQRIFEVETLAAAGEDREAARRVEELEKLAPADPDVAGWKRSLSAPEQPRSTGEVDVDKMAQELFAGDDLSFETRSKFNSSYAGAKINWDGRVKRIRRVGESVTLTVTVATVHNDLYGNTDIDVLVDTAATGAPAEGAEVTVSGMLGRIDPLMRNIYIENAVIS